MTEFTSKWLTWEPPETLKGGTDKTVKSLSVTLETLRVRTDKTDRSPFGSFGSSYSTHSQGNVAALGEAANERLAVPVVQDAVSADRPLPGSNQTTPETLRVGTAKTDKRWDRETAALIKWFLGTKPPTHPFRLQRAVTIARPDSYWDYLRGDIAAGPSRARGKTGAFQENLRQLYRVLHDGKDVGGGTP